MKGVVSLDTMHISVKYPKVDAFLRWHPLVEGLDYGQLSRGVAAGDFVLRAGASGYKVSVWLGDARVYLTDSVDDVVGEGNGMGVWLQLGPKFLLLHRNGIRAAVVDLLEKIGVKGSWAMKITRLDVALDLLGVSMKDQRVEDWRGGWVGRSKVSSCHFNSRSGELETINIGSRGSGVCLRVYDKIAQAIKDGDIFYWLAVLGEPVGAVTRLEWEVRPKEGGFDESLADLDQFSEQAVAELLVYLLDWGKLCVFEESGRPRCRWEEASFWRDVRSVVEGWRGGGNRPISRSSKEFNPVSKRYARFLSGAISGGMARFGVGHPSMVDMLDGLERYGEGNEKIRGKAREKYDVYSRLR